MKLNRNITNTWRVPHPTNKQNWLDHHVLNKFPAYGSHSKSLKIYPLFLILSKISLRKIKHYRGRVSLINKEVKKYSKYNLWYKYWKLPND